MNSIQYFGLVGNGFIMTAYLVDGFASKMGCLFIAFINFIIASFMLKNKMY